MRSFVKLGAASASALALIAVVIAACGDGYDESDGPLQGALDGRCFPNSTCNVGLACQLIDGDGKCRPPATTTDAGAIESGAPEASSGSPDAGPDAPTPRCIFSPTAFTCKADTACYGFGVDGGMTCAASAEKCGSATLPFDCFSGHYCSKNVCCLKASSVKAAGTTCDEGSIDLNDSDTSKCTDECVPSDLRLCQSNDDCPDGKTCSPYRIFAAQAALSGSLVGACR